MTNEEIDSLLDEVVGVRTLAELQAEVDATNAASAKELEEFYTMVMTASSWDQLRKDAIAAMPRWPINGPKWARMFAGEPTTNGTRYTSLDQLQRDFQIEYAKRRPSFFMRMAGPLPVWGWGLIGGGVAALGTILALIFRRRSSRR